jgi:hypothetical protein
LTVRSYDVPLERVMVPDCGPRLVAWCSNPRYTEPEAPALEDVVPKEIEVIEPYE